MTPALWAVLALATASLMACREPDPARPGAVQPLPPGLYEIRALHSGLCLGEVAAVGPRFAHLVQQVCSSTAAQRFAVTALEGGGYAIRTGDRCATVARGVILGAPAIDVAACDAAPMCVAGRADQAFRLRFIQGGPSRLGDIYEVRAEGGDCWDVRDAGRGPDADVIRFGCSGRDNQRFRFRWIGRPGSAEEARCAERAGWPQLLPADFTLQLPPPLCGGEKCR